MLTKILILIAAFSVVFAIIMAGIVEYFLQKPETDWRLVITISLTVLLCFATLKKAVSFVRSRDEIPNGN